jgi:hypothetical protein
VLRRRLELVLLFTFASSWAAPRARGDDMELALTRLSRGDCAATLGGPAPLVLSRDGAPTLTPDQRAFRQLVTELSPAVAPVELSPVITTGPIGLDVSLQTTLTALSSDADYWARATRGGVGATCDMRNEAVGRLLVSQRARVEKGLPLGLTLGASVGFVYESALYLMGLDLKLAVLEDVWKSRVPDLAVRAAAMRVLGAGALELTVGTLSGIISERYVVGSLQISPYLGLDLLWTRARTSTVDLTPNIDALACRDGTDPVCQAASISGSAEDFAHDVRFARISLLRYRALAGLLLRHRRAFLSGSLVADALAPRLGERGRGEKAARQWTVSIAPGVAF